MNDFASARILVPTWIGPRLLSFSELGRIPDRVGGIYMLHAFAQGLGGYPVFYAGRSQDLKRRLSDHLDFSRCKGCIRAIRASERAYFSAAILPADVAIGVEAGLVRMLRPVCNDQTPRAAPILVTLPPLSTTTLLKGDLK